MEKYFVTYNQALALNDLGFKEPCIATIDQTEYFHIKGTKQFPRGAMMYYTIDLPLKSQVFEFFRGYRLTVVIEDYLDDYEVKIVEWTLSDDRITHEFPNRFDSWDDAESAAIDKLIEIVKNK